MGSLESLGKLVNIAVRGDGVVLECLGGVSLTMTANEAKRLAAELYSAAVLATGGDYAANDDDGDPSGRNPSF